MTRRRAETLLEQEAVGSFIIRKSKKGTFDDLVLTFKMTKGRCTNYRIKINRERTKITLDEKYFFNNVEHMISHYIKTPLSGGLKLIQPSQSFLFLENEEVKTV